MLDSLMYISRSQDKNLLGDEFKRVLDYGLKLIQLRVKNINDFSDDKFQGFYTDCAELVVRIVEDYNANLIINDNVKIAKHVNAFGVHLGRDDHSISEARKILGEEKVIGGTANSGEDISSVIAAGADYIGLGPLRFTDTKKNLSPVLGFDGYRELLNTELSIPVFAIGGVVQEDIKELKDLGLYGIAVSSLIDNNGSEDLVRRIKETFENEVRR